MEEKLGKFGHHPDPANDFCVEVETLQGLVFDVKHGISKPGENPIAIEEVQKRFEKAMEFRVGGDEIAVHAKHLLRQLENEIY